MTSFILNVFKRNYPRNYLIQNPLKGALLAFIITLTFMLLYRPLDLSDNKLLVFELAMAIYSFLASITGLVIVLLLKKTSIFSDKARWTFAKELTVIFICLSMMSLVIYAAGF